MTTIKSNTGFQFIIEKGFASELPTVSQPTVEIKEEIVVEKKPEFVLDVPSFMKKAPVPAAAIEPEMGQVIYAADKFKPKKERRKIEDMTAEEVKEKFDDVLGRIGKVVTKNPVFKYFFDAEVKKK